MVGDQSDCNLLVITITLLIRVKQVHFYKQTESVYLHCGLNELTFTAVLIPIKGNPFSFSFDPDLSLVVLIIN